MSKGKYDKYFEKSITYNIFMLMNRLTGVSRKYFILDIFRYTPENEEEKNKKEGSSLNYGNIYGSMMDCYTSISLTLDYNRFREFMKNYSIKKCYIATINDELYNILDKKINGKYYDGTARVKFDKDNKKGNYEPENFKDYDKNLIEKLKEHILFTENYEYNIYSMLYFAVNKELPKDFYQPKKFFEDDLEEFSREVTQKYGAVSTPSVRQIISLAKRKENPNIVALYELADMYYYGNNCIEKDISKAFDLYFDAAGLNLSNIYNHDKKRFHPLALWSLGYIIHNYHKENSKLEKCEDIRTIEKLTEDEKTDLIHLSVHYTLLAYKMMNSPAAANLLGNILSSVSDKKRKELTDEFQLESVDYYYRFAQDHNYVYAVNNLAAKEEALMKNATNEEEARKHCNEMIKCLKKSASQYEVWASNKLGRIYKDGISWNGVCILEKDRNYACRYFRKAVENYIDNGSEWACHYMLVEFPTNQNNKMALNYAECIVKMGNEKVIEKTRELWPKEYYNNKSFDEFLKEVK